MTAIRDFINELRAIEREYPDIDVEVFALSHNGTVRQDSDPVLYLGQTLGTVDTLSITVDHPEFDEIQVHWELWMASHRLTHFTRLTPVETE